MSALQSNLVITAHTAGSTELFFRYRLTENLFVIPWESRLHEKILKIFHFWEKHDNDHLYIVSLHVIRHLTDITDMCWSWSILIYYFLIIYTFIVYNTFLSAKKNVGFFSLRNFFYPKDIILMTKKNVHQFKHKLLAINCDI